jgi:hypothetical protein
MEIGGLMQQEYSGNHPRLLVPGLSSPIVTMPASHGAIRHFPQGAPMTTLDACGEETAGPTVMAYQFPEFE